MPPAIHSGQAAIPCGFGGHRGFIIEKTGESQRILPHAVAQRFETSSSGALVPPTEGSTKPVSLVITNAGVARIERYDLWMP
jgi:hypothetical protein